MKSSRQQPAAQHAAPIAGDTFVRPTTTPALQATSTEEYHGLYGKAAFLAMTGIALVILLSSLDQTIVSTALPRIIADLHGFEFYPWVATAYLLTSTIAVPIMGKLGDLYGRKPFLLVAILIFIGASAVAGIAWNMLVLIIARGVQGIGAGMFLSGALASVGDMFPQPQRRARWQGMLTGMFGLGSVVGPGLGGIMTDTLGWRSVFYVNLPIGVLAMVVLWVTLPTNLSPRAARGRIDGWGILTITLAITSMLLLVEWGGSHIAWFSPAMAAMVLVCVLLWAAFIMIEQRTPEPLMPLDLFTQKTVALCSLLSFLSGFAVFALVFYTPLFVQGGLGLSASAAGMLQTPLVACMSLGSLASGQLFARTGRPRALMIAGAIILMTGSLLLSLVTLQVNHVLFSAELALCGLGVGLLFPMYIVLVQSTIPRERMGVGTATVQFLRLNGSTIGTVIIGALISSTFTTYVDVALPPDTNTHLAALLRDPQTLVNDEAQAQVMALVHQVGTQKTIPFQQLIDISKEALTISIHRTYLLVAATTLVIFIFILFLDSKAHLREGNEYDRPARTPEPTHL